MGIGSLVEWVQVVSYVGGALGSEPVGRIRRHELSNIGITTFGDQDRMSATQVQIAMLRLQPTWEDYPFKEDEV